jgi:hypothetical protein
MSLRVLGLLALLAGCGKGPAAAFDAGQHVHVIVKLTERPKVAIGLRPVVTIGERVAKSERRPLGPKGPLALETAVVRVPRGDHRLSIWEPTTRTGARDNFRVEGDLWIVMEIAPGARQGRLRYFDRPPHAEIGKWIPLVPVPH